MSLRGSVAIALLTALAAGRAAACDSCAVPAAVLPRFTASCQQVSGRTDSSCTSDFYAMDLFAGDLVALTLCSATCPSAGGDFNALLRIYDPSCTMVNEIDDWCGELPELWWNATTTGRHLIEVTGSTPSDRGDYTLAWYGFCGDQDCWTPAGDIGDVTTACQLLSDTLACTQRTWSVTLTQGQTYTFTLCPTTCLGADARFDSVVELVDPSGVVVATSTDACGFNGEVVYATDPTTGGGTYCVRIRSEDGWGGYDLGYRVACQAPSDLTLSPLQARTTLPACSELETFTVTTAGTPAFAVDWRITPPTGGTATPASGTFAMTRNSGAFQSLLSGRGIYRVDVTVQNECGRAQRQYQYELRDTTAPDLTLSATAGCGPPVRPPDPGPAPAPLPSSSSAFSDAVRLEGSASEPMAEIKRAASARPGGRLLTSRMPGVRRPPEAAAVGCATPCTTGTIEADHPMYDVFLSCDDGSFTARTGTSHPVTIGSGVAQNVIFGGATGQPGTSDIAWYFHELGLMMQDPPSGRACVFDPPDTPVEPNSIGIEMEWVVTPEPGLVVTLREEIVAFGTDETDSGVRLTLGAESSPSSTRTPTMGVRWQIDYQNASDDGPLFATVTCAPPEIVGTLDVEHELAPGEIRDFYRIQNNTGTPVFANFTNTTEIAGFSDTGTPDRLTYGYWYYLRNSVWDRPAIEGNTGPDSDSAVHYWFGARPAEGITVMPGSGFTRSVVIFTSGEAVECGGFTPGTARNAEVEVCEGDCARLGAVATDACTTATVMLVSSSPGAPACAGNPCDVTFPTVGTYTYTWEATDADGNATQATATVVVRPPGECLTGPCQATGVAPPASVTICEGDRTTLDASTLSLVNCPGNVRYEWREAGRVVSGNPTVTVQPSATTTYVVTVTCDGDASCSTTASVTVQVVRHPIAGGVSVRDLAACNLGLEVTWAPATFFNGGGVYNVYRSTVSCADARTQPPVATGLTTLSHVDLTTEAGVEYFYAVEAEDDPPASGCAPTGRDHGGPADVACAAPATDQWDGTVAPAEVWAALRVAHAGQRVTLDWSRARALLAGEHFHVLKAWMDPTSRLDHVNGEGAVARTWSETDTSTWLQFFDLRIANACETVSPKEYPIYPPGYDLPR